jgi:hypothetical protein
MTTLWGAGVRPQDDAMRFQKSGRPWRSTSSLELSRVKREPLVPDRTRIYYCSTRPSNQLSATRIALGHRCTGPTIWKHRVARLHVSYSHYFRSQRSPTSLALLTRLSIPHFFSATLARTPRIPTDPANSKLWVLALRRVTGRSARVSAASLSGLLALPRPVGRPVQAHHSASTVRNPRRRPTREANRPMGAEFRTR